jgi:hypothetical protein
MTLTAKTFQNLQPGVDLKDLRARVPINAALTYLSGLAAEIDAGIAADITALKAASNTWSNTNNFTGTVQLAGVGLLAGLRGHIGGLTLSNNGADATNDIDIAVGAALAGDQSALLVLSSALTKRLDAAWAVGTNQGGLDTGSIADTTYHVWLIRRPDTGVVDVLFSASATAPTMPADYTQNRRIGSIIRTGGAIVPFLQFGDMFKRDGVTDRNSTSAAASALLAVSVPLGIVVAPLLRLVLTAGTSDNCAVQIGDAAFGSANITMCQVNTGAGDTSETNIQIVPGWVFTNTSAQIYFAQLNIAGTPTASTLDCFGWIDRRGRDD